MWKLCKARQKLQSGARFSIASEAFGTDF